MTGTESLLVTGSVVFLGGIAGFFLTLSSALCDWLDERERRSARRG